MYLFEKRKQRLSNKQTDMFKVDDKQREYV